MSLYHWNRICLASMLALSVSGLCAHEGDHEEVNSRPVSSQVRLATDERRAAEADEQDEEDLEEADLACEESDDDSIALEESDEENLFDEDEMVMGAYYQYNGYPRQFDGSHHWPTGRSVNGDTIDTEDGCKWEICKSDALTTLDWEMTDRIVVMANNDRGSMYHFELVNLDTDVSVRANLAVGPYSSGTYTIHIASIDYATNRAIVCDGSGRELTISMSSFDTDIVRRWAVGDAVVMGVNNDWISWWNPYIVINVSTIEFARASVSQY